MSWLYLPESAAASSAQNTDSAGAPSVMSSVTPTPSPSSRPASETDTLTTPPSGTMSAPLTDAPGLASWMSSLRASRVSRSAWQGNGPGRGMGETDGRIPFALFEKSVPSGFSLKTSLDYSAQWTSPQKSLFHTLEPYSATWPRAGTMRTGVCYRRRKWERRISGIGSGLWPTITSSDAGRAGAKSQWEEYENNGKTTGYRLRNYVQMFPAPTTPRPHDDEKTAGKYLPSQKQKDLTWAVHHFPTPNARDWRSAKRKDSDTSYYQLNKTVWELEEKPDTPGGGQLNPDWVEWLMGWPIGWTALEPLATDRFQKWRQSLFAFLRS